MKARVLMFAATALWLGSAVASSAQQADPAVPDQLNVTIDTQKTAPPISKYLYGQFIEHIGSTMYSSLWAEMLDDRKFYFPITAKKPEPPSARGGGMFRVRLRQWYPVGPEDAVSMDKDAPFVGDQSPRIALDSTTPHGIQQEGLALVNGKKYTGRIYLRGTPGSKVKVSLIWGKGEGDRQAIAIPALAGEYKKFPFTFTSKADTTEASIEITGTGTGSFHIGTAIADARRQCAGIPGRYYFPPPPDQDGLLALWRQLHLWLDLVPHRR